jgi:hypothetical protein
MQAQPTERYGRLSVTIHCHIWVENISLLSASDALDSTPIEEMFRMSILHLEYGLVAYNVIITLSRLNFGSRPSHCALH